MSSFKNFIEVVEVSKANVSREQLERSFHRYMFAREICQARDVLDIGSGTGVGLNLLFDKANSITSGDISLNVLKRAKKKYPKELNILNFRGENLPFINETFGLIIGFEVIYYLENTSAFLQECRRVLKSNGSIILSTPNNALYDFTPSKYATKYYNVPDLHHILMRAGFNEIQFFGFHRVDQTSIRQKLLRPIKALASKTNLIPGSMKGKEVLKKLYFGDLLEMPDKLEPTLMEFQRPDEIDSKTVNNQHKIIYCVAKN